MVVLPQKQILIVARIYNPKQYQGNISSVEHLNTHHFREGTIAIEIDLLLDPILLL